MIKNNEYVKHSNWSTYFFLTRMFCGFVHPGLSSRPNDPEGSDVTCLQSFRGMLFVCIYFLQAPVQESLTNHSSI